MDNARLLHSNAWDSAVLTQSAGTFEAALPAANTQRYNNSRVFRTQDLAEIEILFDWSEATFIDAIAFWRHNLTSAAELRVELYAGTAQSGTKVFDSGVLLGDAPKTLGDLVWGKDALGDSASSGWKTRSSAFWFEGTHLALSGRLTISDPSNPDGFLEVCRVYAGESFTPTFNVDLGHAFTWANDTEAKPTAGGTVHTVETAVYRTLDFDLSHLTPGDRAIFSELVREVSTHKDFFVALRPNAGGTIERDYSFAAKFSKLPSLKKEPGRYASSCSLREV